MTRTLPASHAAFLDKARGILSTDPRMHALLAGGSLIHGDMDEFSDLDFVVVIVNHDVPVLAAHAPHAIQGRRLVIAGAILSAVN